MNLLYLIGVLPVVLCSSFKPDKIGFMDLFTKSEHAKERLMNGLTEVGLVTVTDVPGFEELRASVLEASTACLQGNNENGFEVEKMILGDGSTRLTMGLETKSGVSSTYAGADLTHDSCSNFRKVEGEFRLVISKVLEGLVDLLDEAVGLTEKNQKLMLDTEAQREVDSISEITKEGTHLEHFHSYTKKSSVNDLYEESFARSLHTDHGLFIVLTPAMNLNPDSAKDHGFFIKLKNGEIVKPDFGDKLNEVVFMLGDGFAQWINPKIKQNFRPTPHAVVMPYSKSGLTTRSWYGRMVLPKSSLFLEPQQMTFGELHGKVMSSESADKSHASSAACSSGLVLGERFLQNCNADNQIFCWNFCTTLECPSDQELACGAFVDDGFVPCPIGTHGSGCNARCIDSQLPVIEIGNDFCNGLTATMYMDGFTGAGRKKDECLIFLFESFVLDSPLKFTIACFISIVMGMIVELVMSMRRTVQHNFKAGMTKSTVKVSLYSFQVAVGYIAMLIAMTYSIILFLMLILGLVIGHRLFNFHIVPEEFSDPCCAQPVETKKPIEEK